MSDSDEIEGNGRRKTKAPKSNARILIPKPTKRFKIYRDKKGNRSVVYNNKRIAVPSAITDASFLKWLVLYLKPRRKPRAPREPRESKRESRPAVSGPITRSAIPDIQDEGQLNYINTERKQKGQEQLDRPVVPGGPPRIADEELKARAERKRAREEEKKRLVDDAKRLSDEKAAAEARIKRQEDRARANAEDSAFNMLVKSWNKVGIQDIVRRTEIKYPISWIFDDVTYEAKNQSTLTHENKDAIVALLLDGFKVPELVEEYQKFYAESLKTFMGSGKTQIRTPMTNTGIDEVMRGYRPKYLGTIARDGWDGLTAGMPSGMSGWVMNTDVRGNPGKHWVSFLLDLDNRSIEYYDSFADPLPKDVGVSLKAFLDQYGPHRELLKFKENRIQDQDSDTANCGWFACKFLIDRFRGKSFREVTKYDDSISGERDVEKFKLQHGGAFDEYM